MTCPSCASEVPLGARFCPSCGHALTQQVDERRIVSVLFGDLVGYTALAEARDPEQVKLLVDRTFDRLVGDIVRYGGHVDKIVGDGIIALFGAPIAHEDDAERAVRAALQMQRTLDELVEELGAPVQMRIGVNSGEVLVGAMRADGDITAMGDVVNTAQRLQTAAQPGQVVVGFETWNTTSETIHYEPLGPLHARGREAPIIAWEAIEPVTAPGERPRRYGVPLIGREAERTLLESAMATAIRNRRPTLVLVYGESGMGKTRLTQDVVATVRDAHGALLLGGRSLPYGEINPWGAVAVGIRTVCAIASDDEVGTVREKLVAAVSAAFGSPAEEPDVQRTVDGLLELVGAEGRLADADPARARTETARAARLFIEAQAARQPVLVAVGDAQWADQRVLDLVDALLERSHRLPIALVVTARPELEERWQPKAGRHNEVVCNLDPLDAEASAELLRVMLGRDPGPALRRELVARSGGNPFFIEELTALLNEPGSQSPASYALLPATLRGVVAARLDALPPDERSVVDDLAVMGHGPRTALVALGAGHASPSAIETAIGRLVDKDVLLVDGDGCEFTTDLIREVAYGTMSKVQRARRHSDLAAWLEDEASIGDRSDELLEEIARHYAAAADLVTDLGEVPGVPDHVRELAVTTLGRAAERADDRELYPLAERLFDQMVELLGPSPSSVRRHAIVGRARARTALHRDQLALADLAIVEAEARAADDEVALARALVVRGDLLRNLADYDGSIAILDEAAALWRRIGDRRGEASALRRIGWTHLVVGDPDRAEPFIREAYAAFTDIGVKRGIAWAQQNLAWIAFLRGDVVVAEQSLAEAIRLFDELGDWGGQAWCAAMLASILFATGRAEEAEALADRITADADAQGDAWSVGMMTLVLASLRLAQGRIAEAAERGQDARRSFRSLDDPWMVARTMPPLADALTLLGRAEEAAGVIDDARSLVEVFPEGAADRLLPESMALQHAVRLGETAAALEALDRLGEVPRAMGFESVPTGHALALLQAGRIDEAAARLTENGPGAATSTRPRAEGAVLAMVLAAQGRPDEALERAAIVLATSHATYIERVIAKLAEAGASVRLGDGPRARRAVDAAELLVAPTDDVVADALVARARAVVLAAIGHGAAGEAEAEADRKAAATGGSMSGWTDALRATVGGTVRAGGGPASG